MLAARYITFVFAITTTFAQPAGNGVIGGIVIDVSTGDPVRKAIVTVTWDGEPKSWATARTTSDGLFCFEGLPAGKYSLRAVKQGSGTAIYGADHVGETGILIPLADGQTRDDLKLRFLHASTISGRVLDPDGDPLSMAQATLYRPGRNLGEQVPVQASGVQTNDRGEYKFSNVQPGHYYISAARGYFPQEPGSGTSLVSVFYGDNPDWKESPVLTVRDGESLTGIDLHLTAVRMVLLHGRVTGLPGPPTEPEQEPHLRKEGPGVQIMVVAADRVGLQGSIGFGVFRSSNEFGGFNLPQGRYQIDAFTPVDGKTYGASQIIDLQPGIGDIELAVSPINDLKGHLVIEGGKAAEASSMQITLAAAQQGRFSNPSAKPAADGNFALQEVLPGEWELNLNPMPRGSFLKSVMLGDKDVRFQRIEIESGSDAALNIVDQHEQRENPRRSGSARRRQARRNSARANRKISRSGAILLRRRRR